MSIVPFLIIIAFTGIESLIFLLIMSKKQKKSKTYFLTTAITTPISIFLFTILFILYYIAMKKAVSLAIYFFFLELPIFLTVSTFITSIIILIAGFIKKHKEKKLYLQQIIINNAKQEAIQENKNIHNKQQYCEYCGCKVKIDEIKCPNCSAIIKKQ